MSGPTIHIRDSGGRLHLRWFCDDSDLWRRILEDFKARFPTHAERCYSATTKTWSIPAWQRRRLEEWMGCWFPAAGQQWDGAEEDGQGHAYSANSGQSSHGRDGHARDGQQQPHAGTLDAAYATLHLRPTAPPELITAAHRVLVKLAHPDVGGDHAAAVAINAAISIIRSHQCQEP